MRVRSRFVSLLIAVVAGIVAAFPLFGCSAFSREKSAPIRPHLIETPEASPVRPINGCEGRAMSDFTLPLSDEAMYLRVNELYSIVVEDRKKPVFSDGDPVKPVYDAAIDVLDRYVLNAWHTEAGGEQKTVHTIHDYLVYYIDYDFELYDRYKNNEAVEHTPSFDINGVFINKRAVCDGLSRAMNFLCAIEGIDCMQVSGFYQNTPHAWNRVKVDGVWYNVDVTFDAANYTIVGDESYRKELAHGFFLLSDATFVRFSSTGNLSDAHVFNIQSDIPAPADCEFYDPKTLITIGSKTFPLTITNQETLNDMFAAISEQNGKVGKIEFKLKFPGKTNVNSGDVYEEELKTAYSKLKDPDFIFKGNQKPYMRYPNGVYLCLMYK